MNTSLEKSWWLGAAEISIPVPRARVSKVQRSVETQEPNEAERAREMTPATNAPHRIILNVH